VILIDPFGFAPGFGLDAHAWLPLMAWRAMPTLAADGYMVWSF
jgi:hypothetical protein